MALDVLNKLAGMDVSVDVMKSTGVGKSIRKLSKIVSGDRDMDVSRIRLIASKIYSSWKAIVSSRQSAVAGTIGTANGARPSALEKKVTDAVGKTVDLNQKEGKLKDRTTVAAVMSKTEDDNKETSGEEQVEVKEQKDKSGDENGVKDKKEPEDKKHHEDKKEIEAESQHENKEPVEDRSKQTEQTEKSPLENEQKKVAEKETEEEHQRSIGVAKAEENAHVHKEPASGEA